MIPSSQADRIIRAIEDAMKREGVTGHIYPLRPGEVQTWGLQIEFIRQEQEPGPCPKSTSTKGI